MRQPGRSYSRPSLTISDGWRFGIGFMLACLTPTIIIMFIGLAYAISMVF